MKKKKKKEKKEKKKTKKKNYENEHCAISLRCITWARCASKYEAGITYIVNVPAYHSIPPRSIAASPLLLRFTLDQKNLKSRGQTASANELASQGASGGVSTGQRERRHARRMPLH